MGENQGSKEQTAAWNGWTEALQERGLALVFAGLAGSLVRCFGLGESAER